MLMCFNFVKIHLVICCINFTIGEINSACGRINMVYHQSSLMKLIYFVEFFLINQSHSKSHPSYPISSMILSLSLSSNLSFHPGIYKYSQRSFLLAS
jgi:hypothetical protein